VKSTVKRWGNSLAVRLPKDLAQTLELDEGSSITLEIVEDGLLVKSSKPRRRDLETLLRGVTRETIHDETDWGEALGKEAW
jgi:antitoxin MazE